VALGEPHYVVRIEADTRRVVLGRKTDLEQTELTALQANWLIEPPSTQFNAAVQIRYNSTAHDARVIPRDARSFRVLFAEPVAGIAPGQAAVVYAGERVLGGGWIAAPSANVE
jgi:tRNA-specific 2-thiouridylase